MAERNSKAVNYQKILADPPEIAWEDGSVLSQTYDDIYFSREDGLAETTHVFLKQNNLPEAWRARISFVIGELGFGTGLNFLATWKLWQETRPKAAWLHYISFEKSPLSLPDLFQVHSWWPELSSYSKKLLAQFPLPLTGFQRIIFADDNLSLTLAIGDAEDFLPQLANTQINAWYFDGFAPRKNPELWSAKIFKFAAERSAADATFATYSASSAAKCALEDAGFCVYKGQGFGKKKHLLFGNLTAPKNHDSTLPSETTTKKIATKNAGQTVVIIGGGLAGCAIARAFGIRNFDVTLIEREPGLARHASGNRAGLLMPHLSASPDTRTRFSLSGFNFTRMLLSDPHLAAIAKWQGSGVLRLSTSARLQSVFERLLNTPCDSVAEALAENQCEAIAGTKLSHSGIFFSKGGYLSPPALCAGLVESVGKNLRVLNNTTALSFERKGGRWEVRDQQDHVIAKASALVIANSNDALSFPVTSWLPLEAVRGEVMHVSETPSSSTIRCPICFDGYIIPAVNGEHLIGATYEHNDTTLAQKKEKQIEMFGRLKKSLPMLNFENSDSLFPGHVAFRASTPDRLPLVGAVVDVDRFISSYKAVKYRDLQIDFSSQLFLENLYVSVGHGSQGLISCLLSGELIASLYCGEPLPLDKELVDLLNPVRFIARKLNRAPTGPTMARL